jgi:hypothetical protein
LDPRAAPAFPCRALKSGCATPAACRLQPQIDLAGDDDPKIIVVMMTPWHAEPNCPLVPGERLPQDLVHALTLTLDWALLASYRMAFETLRQRNELAAMAAHMQAAGVADLPRVPKPVRMPLVIAPQELRAPQRHGAIALAGLRRWGTVRCSSATTSFPRGSATSSPPSVRWRQQRRLRRDFAYSGEQNA